MGYFFDRILTETSSAHPATLHCQISATLPWAMQTSFLLLGGFGHGLLLCGFSTWPSGAMLDTKLPNPQSSIHQGKKPLACVPILFEQAEVLGGLRHGLLLRSHSD